MITSFKYCHFISACTQDMLWEEGVPCLGQGSYEIGQTIKTGEEVGASEVVHPTFPLTAAGLSEILAPALRLPAPQHALNPS